MRQYSMPKVSLLTKSSQYDRVYKQGERIRAKGVTFIYAPNTRGHNRLGISVSGMKSAVKRNRIKRLVREFYRFHPMFPSALAGAKANQTGFDLVVATNNRFVPKGLDHLKTIFLSFLPTLS